VAEADLLQEIETRMGELWTKGKGKKENTSPPFT